MIAIERLQAPLAVETAALLSTLHAQCFPTPWAAGEIAGLAAAPGAITVLARQCRDPLGFALVRCAADEAEIITIGVVPGARRGGVGQALLRAAADHARGAGAARLFIDVAADNVAALGLYRHAGFAEVGRRRRYYGESGQDALVMRLDLGS